MQTVLSSLTFLSRTPVPAVEESFVVKEKIPHVPGAGSVEGGIFCIGNNFDRWFGELEQGPISQSTIDIHLLTKEMSARDILRELSSPEKTFAHLFSVWERYKGDEHEDVLARYGNPNLFFIRDQLGESRIANVHEYGTQWCVLVCGIDLVPRWSPGTRVFS